MSDPRENNLEDGDNAFREPNNDPGREPNNLDLAVADDTGREPNNDPGREPNNDPS